MSSEKEMSACASVMNGGEKTKGIGLKNILASKRHARFDVKSRCGVFLGLPE